MSQWALRFIVMTGMVVRGFLGTDRDTASLYDYIPFASSADPWHTGNFWLPFSDYGGEHLAAQKQTYDAVFGKVTTSKDILMSLCSSVVILCDGTNGTNHLSASVQAISAADHGHKYLSNNSLTLKTVDMLLAGTLVQLASAEPHPDFYSKLEALLFSAMEKWRTSTRIGWQDVQVVLPTISMAKTIVGIRFMAVGGRHRRHTARHLVSSYDFEHKAILLRRKLLLQIPDILLLVQWLLLQKAAFAGVPGDSFHVIYHASRGAEDYIGIASSSRSGLQQPEGQPCGGPSTIASSTPT